MATVSATRHVVLTGPPGVGKTTLIKAASEALLKQSIPVQGFYTEELRTGGKRIGFDVVTLDGQRGPLARIRQDGSFEGVNPGRQQPKVGNYTVKLQDFEQLALPTLRSKSGSPIYIVDEVGKMELFSRSFEQTIRTLLDSKSTSLLMTIPVPKHQPIKLVEYIRNHPDATLFEISVANRNTILEEILQALQASTGNRLPLGS